MEKFLVRWGVASTHRSKVLRSGGYPFSAYGKQLATAVLLQLSASLQVSKDGIWGGSWHSGSRSGSVLFSTAKATQQPMELT